MRVQYEHVNWLTHRIQALASTQQKLLSRLGHQAQGSVAGSVQQAVDCSLESTEPTAPLYSLRQCQAAVPLHAIVEPVLSWLQLTTRHTDSAMLHSLVPEEGCEAFAVWHSLALAAAMVCCLAFTGEAECLVHREDRTNLTVLPDARHVLNTTCSMVAANVVPLASLIAAHLTS